MGIFNRKIPETRIDQAIDSDVIDDQLLRSLLGTDQITRDQIMNIPSISACVNRIGDTISSLQIKLYRKEGEKIEEISDDPRLTLLNEDTGDTLDGMQFKKAMIVDMYLGKGGYAYVNRVGRTVRSIHYVDERHISYQHNTDPIFKDYKIGVNGNYYEGFQFIKLLRNTTDGFKGRSIIEESPILLQTIYSTELFEENMVKTGGNKKGFIQSTTRLSTEAMTKLKQAFRNLYSNNSENVVVLNDGLSFKESSNTSVELQLNENKETNNNDVCKVFLIPPSIINGGASEEDKKLYYEGCILPILQRFSTALNRVLLTEDEKSSLFFAFDDTDLIKGDIEKRFKAYEIACKNGFMQVDEVRKNEKLPAFGLDFIKLGLQDVIYYPSTGEIYTPNTNKLTKMGEEEPAPAESDKDPSVNIQNTSEGEDLDLDPDPDDERGDEIT